LSKGVMVAMFNSPNSTRTITADFNEIPGLNENSYRGTNTWTGKKLGCKKGSVKMTLNAHGTAALLLKKACG
jgi:alpha-galactosidase